MELHFLAADALTVKGMKKEIGEQSQFSSHIPLTKKSKIRNKRNAVSNKTNSCCVYCGIQLDPTNYTLEHLFSKKDCVKKSVRVHQDNLFIACATCNNTRGSGDAIKFAKEKDSPFIYLLEDIYSKHRKDWENFDDFKDFVHEECQSVDDLLELRKEIREIPYLPNKKHFLKIINVILHPPK
jgi:hypothetical protein